MVTIANICFEVWSKEPNEWPDDAFVNIQDYSKTSLSYTIFGESKYINMEILKAQTFSLVDAIIDLGLCPESNRESRQLIKNGAIFINDSQDKIKDINYKLSEKDILKDKDVIVIGRKNDYNFYQIIRD